MKTMLRWTANAVAFYLALYLVDSVAGGRFKIGAVWVAVVLAVILGLLNSLIRPLHRVKSKPGLAISEAVVTVLINALVLQIVIWAGGPLSTAGIAWVFVMAAFLALLGSVINWLIGFKKKETPASRARERRAARTQQATAPKRGAEQAPDARGAKAGQTGD